MVTAMVNATHPNGIMDPLFRYAFYWTTLARHISSCMRRVTRVKRDRASEIVTELSEIESEINQVCEIIIQSRYSGIRCSVRILIVPKTRSLSHYPVLKSIGMC